MYVNVIKDDIKVCMSKWLDDSEYDVSYSINDLETGVGYMSNREVQYNPKFKTFIVDHGSLVEFGNKNDFGKFFNEIAKEDIVFRLSHLISKAPASQFPLSNSDAKELLSKTVVERESIIRKMVNNHSLSKMAESCHPKQAGSIVSPYWIDWHQTLEGFDAKQIVELLLCINDQIIAIDYAKDNLRQVKENLTITEIKRTPFFKFLLIAKLDSNYYGDKDTRLINLTEDKLSLLIQEHILDAKETKTRTGFANLVYAISQQVKGLLVHLMTPKGGHILYPPFFLNLKFITNYSLDLLSENVFIRQIKEAKQRTNKSHSTMLNRFYYFANSFNCVSDFPEDIFLILREQRTAGSGYNTSSGLPFKAVKDWFGYLEANDDWVKRVDYKPFPQQMLSGNTYVRIQTASKGTRSIDLINYKGKAPDAIHKILKEHALKYGNADVVTFYNGFLDWVIERNSSETSFKTMHDFTTRDFYDPTGKTNLTFYEFLHNIKKSTGEPLSLNTLRSYWVKISEFFSSWASQETVNSGTVVGVAIPQPKHIFPAAPSKSTTHRQFMPTSIHEMLLDITTRNDYEFFRNLPQSSLNLKNYITNEYEKVFIPHIAHIVHLLLIIPMRGHQARWLDEGLLDDKVWSLAEKCYIENTSCLAGFKYPDGRTHTEKFGRTGVLSSITGSYLEMNLYLNTNKTKEITLQQKGHTGYSIPWPSNTDIAMFENVYDIIDRQKTFNRTYAPDHICIPVKVSDENAKKYSAGTWDNLPYFVPLFRDPRATRMSAMAVSQPKKYADRQALYLPPSGEVVRSTIQKLFKAADAEFRQNNPHFTAQNILLDDKGDLIYDVHSLRVYGISSLLERGVPTDVVMALVGHATEVMTIYYKKVSSIRFKQLLIKAADSKGISDVNELEYLRNNEELIANFSLVEDWNLSPAAIQTIDPSKETSGLPKLAGGGVCFGYDCRFGGVDITLTKRGDQKVNVTNVGEQRCGNCRYWQSGERFLLEQIYYINKIGDELTDLAGRRTEILNELAQIQLKVNADDYQFRLTQNKNKLDELMAEAASYVVERKRRLAMYEASLQKSGEMNSSSKNPLLNLDSDSTKLVQDASWQPLNKFESAMEVSIQGAILGLDTTGAAISQRELAKFLQKLSVAAEAKDELIFAPDNKTKQLAIMYKLQSAVEMVGRTFKDEEYKDPRILIQNLGLSDLSKLKLALEQGDMLIESTNNKKKKELMYD
ncbi:hypothetical protein CWB71_18285 [Pseudoalteromonas sp. S983]|nr:hypothetical protein CWB71_18285 [Pseudoalteromonas sp. S983]